MKKALLLAITSLASIAAADIISELNKEFSRRDNIKLSAQEGAVINYLRALKVPLTDIVELDARTDSNQSFFYNDRKDIICYGQMAQQNLRCKNALGITGMSFNDEGLLTLPPSENSTTLEQEFARRDATTFSVSATRVLNFLKSIGYTRETIVELETLGDISESFFIKDQNDIVCFGSVMDQMLRCKNEIGITGITFTGDSD